MNPIPKPISIIVADDHKIFREGLKTVLKGNRHLKIAGEAANGYELIQLCQSCNPNVVLTDIIMPDMDGITATKYLHEHFVSIKIIALSIYGQETQIVEMLHAGAMGYLLKSASLEEIIKAIETVQKNEPYFSKEITEKMTKLLVKSNQSNYQTPLLLFNENEKQIMRLICEEYTSKEISMKLKLTKRTVDEYRKKIMQRIGAKSVAGIITYSFRCGIYKIN